MLSGLVAGWIATKTLDWVSQRLYEAEKDSDRIREDETRGGLYAYERAADQLSRWLGVPLQRKDLAVWGKRLHQAFGISGGPVYSLLRTAFPGLAGGNGLLFGTVFFVFADELLVPGMRWTPGPTKFSWKVHARGALSHLAYGIAAETTLRALEKARGALRSA